MMDDIGSEVVQVQLPLLVLNCYVTWCVGLNISEKISHSRSAHQPLSETILTRALDTVIRNNLS